MTVPAAIASILIAVCIIDAMTRKLLCSARGHEFTPGARGKRFCLRCGKEED